MSEITNDGLTWSVTGLV